MPHTTPPPARERNRDGIRLLRPDVPLEPGEGLIDRMTISVRGMIHCQSEDGVGRIINRLTAPSATRPGRLFGAASPGTQQLRARVVAGHTISHRRGGIVIDRRGERAGVKINLHLNPSRTLVHILSENRMGDVAELSPRDFFRFSPSAAVSTGALDRKDNMIVDYLAAGGRVYRSRTAALSRFFDAYERALKALLLDELCPQDQGYVHDIAGNEAVARFGADHVRLDWHELAVSQCEVYWERKREHALRIVANVADNALRAARTARVRRHLLTDGLTVERVHGALSVVLPQNPTQSVQLAIYAKARDRLRMEVRYIKEVPQDVRRRLPSEHTRLSSWINALREDAAARVPWRGLYEALQSPPNTADVGDLLDLIEAVSGACEGDPELRRDVLEQLLVTGGLSAGDGPGGASWHIIGALDRSGVIEYVRLVRREAARSGTRYRLTARYAGLRLQGIAPTAQ